MEQNPIFYDGSVSFQSALNDESPINEQLQITDEMRKNIGFNPYFVDNNQ
ncbi:hypothetical protein [Bacillus sp. T33-2]|nr:hypothetical protein [Bacillus sp. T33-2]